MIYQCVKREKGDRRYVHKLCG